MSNDRTHHEDSSLSNEVYELQVEGRTLHVNQFALEQLRDYDREYLSQLIYEADRIARRRRGDDIQSGDIEQAKAYLEGKAQGNYWALFLGSSFFGAGLAGLVDAVVTQKGIPLTALYCVFIGLGLLLVYYAAPSR
jgi:hypothetical protein